MSDRITSERLRDEARELSGASQPRLVLDVADFLWDVANQMDADAALLAELREELDQQNSTTHALNLAEKLRQSEAKLKTLEAEKDATIASAVKMLRLWLAGWFPEYPRDVREMLRNLVKDLEKKS